MGCFIFLFAGINSTIFLDMRAGNVSVIEQAFIWLAFFFFCGGIILVLRFIDDRIDLQGLPMAFLLLLWLTDLAQTPPLLLRFCLPLRWNDRSHLPDVSHLFGF